MEEANAKDVWRAALGELELQVTKPYFETYLKGTLGLSLEGDRFAVSAPNSFVTEWLRLKMKPRIEETLAGLLERPVTALFQVSSQHSTKKDIFAPSEFVEGEVYEDSGPGWGEGHSDSSPHVRLNRHYTFGSIVVARFNRVAYAAAQAVSENKECPFNPLFIYGEAGLGKTHLLHAIGHLAKSKGRSMLYVGAEQFTTDYAEAARDRNFGAFRHKYRTVDLLMVDDIQFIGGKRQTQEGFFHIFNHLHETNRQLVLAGDGHPREIEGLDPRLVSRFEGGLLADVKLPGLGSRVKILKLKCANMDVEVPTSALEMIARVVDGSIRRLEGALHRVLALAKAETKDVTPALVTEALVSEAELHVGHTTPEAIIESTAQHFGLSIEDVIGNRRLKHFVHARSVAMYLIREELRLPPMRIGALFGDRTPAGVSASYKKVSEHVPTSKSLRRDLSQIRDMIFAGPRA